MILINMDTPTEGLLHSQPNTQCYVNTRCLGAGDLYIAERCGISEGVFLYVWIGLCPTDILCNRVIGNFFFDEA